MPWTLEFQDETHDFHDKMGPELEIPSWPTMRISLSLSSSVDMSTCIFMLIYIYRINFIIMHNSPFCRFLSIISAVSCCFVYMSSAFLPPTRGSTNLDQRTQVPKPRWRNWARPNLQLVPLFRVELLNIFQVWNAKNSRDKRVKNVKICQVQLVLSFRKSSTMWYTS